MGPRRPGIIAAARKQKHQKEVAVESQMASNANAMFDHARKQVWDLLTPQNVFYVLNMVQGNKIEKFIEQANSKKNAEAWHDTVCNFSVVPKYWMWALMVDIFPDLDEYEHRVCKELGSDGPRSIFYAVMGIRGNTKMPPHAHDKKVCDAMLRLRYAAVGNRLQALVANMKKSTNFKELGIYSWGRDASNRIEFRHLSGASCTLPPGKAWSETVRFENNWSDDDAKLTDGDELTIQMRQYFDTTEFQNLDLLGPFADHALEKLDPDRYDSLRRDGQLSMSAANAKKKAAFDPTMDAPKKRARNSRVVQTQSSAAFDTVASSLVPITPPEGEATGAAGRGAERRRRRRRGPGLRLRSRLVRRESASLLPAMSSSRLFFSLMALAASGHGQILHTHAQLCPSTLLYVYVHWVCVARVCADTQRTLEPSCAPAARASRGWHAVRRHSLAQRYATSPACWPISVRKQGAARSAQTRSPNLHVEP